MVLKGTLSTFSPAAASSILPAVHNKFPETWWALYLVCINPSTLDTLNTVDGVEEKVYSKLPQLLDHGHQMSLYKSAVYNECFFWQIATNFSLAMYTRLF